MPRRAVSITQAAIARALRAAQQAGPHWHVEIAPDGAIRLFQNGLSIERSCDVTGRSAERRADVGHHVTAANVKGVVRRWYDQLGFDPDTMSNDDLFRLQKAADDRWLASIPGSPLGKRERDTLAQLASHGVGVAVHWSKIKGCGIDTMERLVCRGFIETKNRVKFPDRIDHLVLTPAGLAAWKARDALVPT